MNLLQRIIAKIAAAPPVPTPCGIADAMREAEVAPRDFSRPPFALPPSASERQHQAWAASYVRKHGSITLKDIRERGCNTPSKVIARLRKAGVVAPIEMDTWELSAKSPYKRYHHSGKPLVNGRAG